MKSPSPREAFGDNEISNIYKFVDYYRSKKADPPYDGKFQREYENNFSLKMGEEGFACAVSTGSSACFLAIQSLELPKNSRVLVSPVSDSSSLIGILLAGLKPILVDTQEESYNSGLKEFQEAYSSDVSAIYLVHTYGNPEKSNKSRISAKQKILS